MHAMTDIPDLCNIADISEISKSLNHIEFRIVYSKIRYGRAI